jgi:hypothetical protein
MIGFGPLRQIQALEIELDCAYLFAKDAVERAIMRRPLEFCRHGVQVEWFEKDHGVDVGIWPGQTCGDAANGNDCLNGWLFKQFTLDEGKQVIALLLYN